MLAPTSRRSGILEPFHKFIEIFFYLFFQILPVLAVAIVLGSFIAAFLPRRTFLDICQGRHWAKAVFLASLAGVISPLGSYAVIPIFTAMIASRTVPLAPLMAFLISSPLISPIDFLNTWGILGSEFAIIRLFSALLVGNAFGALIHLLEKKGFLEYPSGPGGVIETGDTMVLTGSTLSPNRWTVLWYSLWKTSKYTAKYFFLSLILAGLTNIFIPQDWIVRTLGGSNYSILLAAAMGLPLYMCGGGAVTLIWQLTQMGMSQGAALAFFIAGPATRIAPLITVGVLVKQKLLLFYFATSFASAIILGSMYQWLSSLM